MLLFYQQFLKARCSTPQHQACLQWFVILHF